MNLSNPRIDGWKTITQSELSRMQDLRLVFEDLRASLLARAAIGQPIEPGELDFAEAAGITEAEIQAAVRAAGAVRDLIESAESAGGVA